MFLTKFPVNNHTHRELSEPRLLHATIRNMPTYVYACSACDTTFEAEQRITEPALDSCNCGSRGTVKRVIQPVGIAFKGSGFHINDYAASKPPESKPSETKTEPATCSGEPATCPTCSTTPAATSSE